jgi:hypothetical protein
VDSDGGAEGLGVSSGVGRTGYNKNYMAPQKMREMRYEGVHCNLTIEQFPEGVVILRISGTDVGEFGDAPMLALNEYLTGVGPVRLFIDAREVRGASVSVSGEWAKWLRAHKVQLRDVSMLTGSRLIEITADFVRRFSELEGTMRIYTESTAFDEAVANALSC